MDETDDCQTLAGLRHLTGHAATRFHLVGAVDDGSALYRP